MIDYVIVNKNYYKLVDSFKIGERVDSNHVPLFLELSFWNRREKKRMRRGARTKRKIKREGER